MLTQILYSFSSTSAMIPQSTLEKRANNFAPLTDLMTIMSQWQKQQLALQQTVQTLRTELIETKTKLSEAQGSAELLAATKGFCKDGYTICLLLYILIFLLH